MSAELTLLKSIMIRKQDADVTDAALDDLITQAKLMFTRLTGVAYSDSHVDVLMELSNFLYGERVSQGAAMEGDSNDGYRRASFLPFYVTTMLKAVKMA